MIRPIPWLLVLSVSMAAQSGFRLESGLRLEGQKKKGGIQTAFGWVATEGEPATLDLAPLLALIEERLLDTPADFVAGRAALARYAIDRGAWQKGRELLADVLERDPDQPMARETGATVGEVLPFGRERRGRSVAGSLPPVQSHLRRVGTQRAARSGDRPREVHPLAGRAGLSRRARWV